MTHSTDKGRKNPSLGAAGTRALTVAVLDSVPIFREGLNAVIHRTPGLRWVGHASSHHAFLQLCEQVRPDIVVVDSGLDPRCHLIRMLSDSDSGLVITVVVRDAQRTAAFMSTAVGAGAHAALPRATDPRRLTEAIHTASADRRYVDPALAALTTTPKRQTAASNGYPTTPGPARMPLTRREYQVLQLVAEGLENGAIAKILYLSVETIRTHVKSILRKLSARDRTHAVTKAFRSGLLVTPTEDAPPAGNDGDRRAGTPHALP